MPIVTFDPEFVLTADFHLQSLADAGDEIEPAFLNEAYTLSLTGDKPAIQGLEDAVKGHRRDLGNLQQ